MTKADLCRAAALAFLARANEGNPAGSAASATSDGGSRCAWHEVRAIARGDQRFPTYPITARVGADEFRIG